MWTHPAEVSNLCAVQSTLTPFSAWRTTGKDSIYTRRKQLLPGGYKDQASRVLGTQKGKEGLHDKHGAFGDIWSMKDPTIEKE